MTDISQLPANTAPTADLFRGLLAHAGDLDHSGLLVERERGNPEADAR